MELLQKLAILADAAKYDVACTSSGSERHDTSSDMLGNALRGGICHSFTADGRCVSLLKILLSNNCAYDCEYCVNRRTNDIVRTGFTAQEVAYLTMEFYKRNYIEGLFLSSAVIGNPDHTMELIINAVRLLRSEMRFNGYIHIKAIPGADEALINIAGGLVDRMSVNVELPSKKSLFLLAPDKKPGDVIKPMKVIRDGIMEAGGMRNTRFVPAGQATQLIIGATPESDMDILGLSEDLYSTFKLKRVFYSAYIPTVQSSRLPAIIKPELKREHRLYQADWLLRFYGFKAFELLDKGSPNLSMELDPKCDWAIRNLSFFPVEVNKAEYCELLRVPGIGMTSARKIVHARRTQRLCFENLIKMRVVLKRAMYFITCAGKMYKGLKLDRISARSGLLLAEKPAPAEPLFMQLSIFDDYTKALTGEL
jgi:putative DNA modification/repair radical SAM protein